MNPIKKTWEKTAGYKTKSGAILYLLFELFKKIFPEVLSEESEQGVKYVIDLLLITGGVDWVWRNRKIVIQWIANLFKKK